MKTYKSSDLTHKRAEVLREAEKNGAIIQERRTNGEVINEFVLLPVDDERYNNHLERVTDEDIVLIGEITTEVYFE